MNIIAVLRLISLRIAVGKLISVGILGGDSSSVNTCKVLVIISFDTVKTVSVGIGESDYGCSDLILATGRSGSKWGSKVCDKFGIKQKKNRVDIGVRVELPAEIFKHITDDVYESKIVYKTDKYNDMVRTFCMNPYGEVVAENTNGIVTVNGHSYADPALRTENTNFALLVSNKFTEPFEDSNEYGESIAKLSNMLGGGVLLQRFGDLVKGRRSSARRMEKCFTRPTLQATPGDLSLVIPKRQLDNIIEMIYALDKIAPGTANEDTLLYGVEVKFYNSKIEVDENLKTKEEKTEVAKVIAYCKENMTCKIEDNYLENVACLKVAMKVLAEKYGCR